MVNLELIVDCATVAVHVSILYSVLCRFLAVIEKVKCINWDIACLDWDTIGHFEFQCDWLYSHVCLGCEKIGIQLYTNHFKRSNIYDSQVFVIQKTIINAKFTVCAS